MANVFRAGDIEAFARAGTLINELSGETIALNKSITELNKNIEETSKKVSDPMDVFRDLEPLTKSIQKSKFSKALDKMGDMFKGMLAASVQTFVLEKLFQLIDPVISLLDLFNPIFSVLAGIIQESMLPIIETLNPLIMEAVTFLQENKEAIIQWITVLSPLILIIELLRGNFEALQPVGDAINALFNDVLIPIWGGLIEAWEELEAFWDAHFAPIFTALGDAWEALGTFWDESVAPIWDALIEAWQSIESFFTGTFSDIWDTLLLVWDTIGLLWNGMFKGVWDDVDEVWNNLITIWNSTFGDVWGNLETAWQDLVDLWNNTFSPIFDALESAFGGVVALFGAAINAMNDAVQAADIFDVVPDFSISIPALREGGIATSPTVGMFGEAGPEAFIPLEDPRAKELFKDADAAFFQEDNNRLLKKLVRFKEEKRR